MFPCGFEGSGAGVVDEAGQAELLLISSVLVDFMVWD